MSFVCIFLLLTPHINFDECCVRFQYFTQWRCSCVSNIVAYLWKGKEKSELLIDVFGVSSFVFTIQIEFSECCVWFQYFTQWRCSCVSNLVPYWCEEKREKSVLLMDVFCVFSFFCLHILDWVQWVLCLISMLHSMILLLFLQCCCLLMRREKCELLMNVFVCILLSSHPRTSWVSVVFDFNVSLNDVAPLSPMLFPVDVKRKE